MCGAISGERRERQGEKRDSRSRKGLGPQRRFKKLLQSNTQTVEEFEAEYSSVWKLVRRLLQWSTQEMIQV